MATWDTGKAKFQCPGCGAEYECEYREYPERYRGSFTCTDCGTVVHAWHASTDYFDFKLVKSGSGPTAAGSASN